MNISASLGALTLTGSVDLLQTSTFSDNGGTLQVQSSMFDAGGIIKTGSGMTTFSGANLYTGPTTVANNGSLFLSNAGTTTLRPHRSSPSIRAAP